MPTEAVKPVAGENPAAGVVDPDPLGTALRMITQAAEQVYYYGDIDATSEIFEGLERLRAVTLGEAYKPTRPMFCYHLSLAVQTGNKIEFKSASVSTPYPLTSGQQVAQIQDNLSTQFKPRDRDGRILIGTPCVVTLLNFTLLRIEAAQPETVSLGDLPRTPQPAQEEAPGPRLVEP